VLAEDLPLTELRLASGGRISTEPLTRVDRAAVAETPRVLFWTLNTSLFAVAVFSCWTLDFRISSIREVVLPSVALLFVVTNTCMLAAFYSARRSARRGTKVVISGNVSRMEHGPVDDDTPMKHVYLGEVMFRIPIEAARLVKSDQLITLHYLQGKRTKLGKLLKVEVGGPTDA